MVFAKNMVENSLNRLDTKLLTNLLTVKTGYFLMKTLIFGAGNQGKVVADILKAQGKENIEFIDDTPGYAGTEVLGVPITGGLESLDSHDPENTEIIVALGVPWKRKSVVEKLKSKNIPFTTIIHPAAVVMDSVQVGDDVVVHPGAIVNTEVILKNHTLVNTGAIIEHRTTLHEGATISPGALLGAHINIGAGTVIGMGATVLSRVSIGEGCIIANGSVVTKDMGDNLFIIGNPARAIKKIGPEFDWDRCLYWNECV